MANKDPNIDDINKAIEEFPKVIKQKEDAYREKERVMKPFMELAAELKKREERAENTPDTEGDLREKTDESKK